MLELLVSMFSGDPEGLGAGGAGGRGRKIRSMLRGKKPKYFCRISSCYKTLV